MPVDLSHPLDLLRWSTIYIIRYSIPRSMQEGIADLYFMYILSMYIHDVFVVIIPARMVIIYLRDGL